MSLNTSFLDKLQSEAKLQARLQQRKIIPQQLDWLGNLVGRKPWQVLLIVSGMTALVIWLV